MGRWLVIAGLALVAALGLGLSQADVTKGRVVRIVDGVSMITSMEPFRDRFIGATLGSI